MKTKAALVWSDGTIKLYTITLVHMNLFRQLLYWTDTNAVSSHLHIVSLR